MTKDEILSIAEKHGCTRSAKHFKEMSDVFYLYEFSLSELTEFARACEKIGMEKCGDMLSDALQSDLENGVKWLNEKAAKDFHTAFPALSKAIGEINSI